MKLPALLTAPSRIFAMTRLQQELALRGGVEEFALDVVRPDGSRTPVMLNAVQDRGGDDGPGLVRLAMWRAAGRRAYEAEVPKARQAAAEASRVKGDFLANMSHELRTPLNGVVGAAAILAARDLTPADRELAEIIQTSAASAAKLLTDLLELADVQAGKLALNEAPFTAADLAGVIERTRLRTEAKGLRLDAAIALDPQTRFVGDAVRLRQTFGELLDNAVKFTPEGSIRFALAHIDGVLIASVEDTGIGFDQETADRLLRPFEQADSGNDRTAGGAGVGLALVQALVVLMEGHLEIRSQPGCGSRFEVRLPLATAPADISSPAPAPGVEDDEQPLRVLLVEDNPVNRRVVELILDSCGAEVTSAEDGALGVAAWRSSPFDLVLMDLQMPVMDGLTATREIRRLENELGRLPRTPIAVLSANAMAHHQREALAAGADIHLAKPITPEALIGGVQTLLSQASA